ncbi:ADP-dependent (S)-NAD(P)H-hydrate dehydratase [Tersicoccus solisilvae]|uniref:ADP-dependent (S)-NAD(P)H-hydrate dehydratase n=1 Tax=Tersicoccus solisilvae TaxID=1882339 RepID=A0ABQ1P3D5_9MICC|nr:ADP/ATP-dependent (S)-NAD(P)H-hydrate dehydratase [Tersicoccus solisilvae]GGC90156.1 ADP-dependent (S)-NAD(P)H-hydrate dehydratase [Tersicoccus solisilvae]
MTRRPDRVTPRTLRRHPLPEASGGKRQRGSVLVIGGSRRTPGAAALTGLAALRVGAGRLTLAIAESVSPAVAVSFPEAGVVGLPEDADGSVLGDCADTLLAEDADAVVIGPGLTDIEQTTVLLRGLLPRLAPDTAVALDAFALGALAHHPELAEPVAGRLLLTPNQTEVGLLLGREPRDEATGARDTARRFDAVVSCGGVVAGPDGLYEVRAGGPGLGTSGSGDVLVGAAGGLLARGASPQTAGLWATWLHNSAGERIARQVGPIGFLARELADGLWHQLAET